jgi:hypothetical protein
MENTDQSIGTLKQVVGFRVQMKRCVQQLWGQATLKMSAAL